MLFLRFLFLLVSFGFLAAAAGVVLYAVFRLRFSIPSDGLDEPDPEDTSLTPSQPTE